MTETRVPTSLTIEDLAALYLLDHPEEEVHIIYGTPDGHDEPVNCFRPPEAAITFSEWGVKNGYFLQSNHEILVELVRKLNTMPLPPKK